MINRIFLETKLSYIQSYAKELENVLAFPNEDIKEDFLKRRALERIIQLIVDEIIDINNHVIRYANLRVPDDFQSSFMVLAENKILPEEFALKISPVVGLRNRLVHRYEKIDLDILLEKVRININDFSSYSKYIFSYIKVESR